MSKDRRFLYAGNRSTVLKRMLRLGLRVTHILPTNASWLAREADDYGLPATTISSKAQATEFIEQAEFDVFVSTGFRFILPISRLRDRHPQATFVNVHPSCLPDLRGADPIPGAVLFRRDSGVTCHLMDDGIDTGQAIARRHIPYFDGLDAKLLYHWCFRIEPEVFQDALERDFIPPAAAGETTANTVYYSFRDGDDWFHADDTPRQLVDRVRAFNTPSKGLRFAIRDTDCRAFLADIIPDAVPQNAEVAPNEWQVTGAYEDCLLVERNGVTVRLSGIVPRPPATAVGETMCTPSGR